MIHAQTEFDEAGHHHIYEGKDLIRADVCALTIGRPIRRLDGRATDRGLRR
jgi:hypothetical protein